MNKDPTYKLAKDGRFSNIGRSIKIGKRNRINEDSIHIHPETKKKLKSLALKPDESFNKIVKRLIREHFLIQLIRSKKQMIEQKEETPELEPLAYGGYEHE